MLEQFDLDSFSGDFYIVRTKDSRIPVAFIGVNCLNQGEALYVDPKYRRQGLGEDLLKMAIKVNMLKAHVYEGNEASIKLCEKCGGKKEGEFIRNNEKFYIYKFKV